MLVEQEERPLVPSRSVPLPTVPHRDLGMDLGTGSPWRTAQPPIGCGRTRQVSLTVQSAGPSGPVWVLQTTRPLLLQVRRSRARRRTMGRLAPLAGRTEGSADSSSV